MTSASTTTPASPAPADTAPALSEGEQERLDTEIGRAHV